MYRSPLVYAHIQCIIILFYGQSEVGIYNSQAEECTSQ